MVADYCNRKLGTILLVKTTSQDACLCKYISICPLKLSAKRAINLLGAQWSTSFHREAQHSSGDPWIQLFFQVEMPVEQVPILRVSLVYLQAHVNLLVGHTFYSPRLLHHSNMYILILVSSQHLRVVQKTLTDQTGSNGYLHFIFS